MSRALVFLFVGHFRGGEQPAITDTPGGSSRLGIAAAKKGARMARPLLKTKEHDGTLYKRLPEIEAAIDAALTQDLETLCRRAKIRDKRATDYLPSECLVHLIRDAHRHN